LARRKKPRVNGDAGKVLEALPYGDRQQFSLPSFCGEGNDRRKALT
jgi:hypothetical protein